MKAFRKKVGSSKYSGIKLIKARPLVTEDRESFAHWEGNTIS